MPGDFISLNGSTGDVYVGAVATKDAELSDDFNALMGLCDNYTKLVKCREIASELLTNYGIECNNKIFRFAEIEFYYYDSEQYLKDKNQYKWQEVTYPRNDYEGGQLFYHLLGKIGTDIHDGLCFFDGSLVKDDWNPKRDRFDTVTYAPYLEFALLLSYKTRQTISFFL